MTFMSIQTRFLRSLRGMTGILPHSSSIEYLVLYPWKPEEIGQDLTTYPMYCIGLSEAFARGSGLALRIHFPRMRDASLCPPYEAKNWKSKIFHAGMPLGLDGPLTHLGSAWHCPAWFRMTTLQQVSAEILWHKNPQSKISLPWQGLASNDTVQGLRLATPFQFLWLFCLIIVKDRTEVNSKQRCISKST